MKKPTEVSLWYFACSVEYVYNYLSHEMTVSSELYIGSGLFLKSIKKFKTESSLLFSALLSAYPGETLYLDPYGNEPLKTKVLFM